MLATAHRTLCRLLQDEHAGTHIEYALLAGFTGVALLGALVSLRDGIRTFYTDLAGILTGIL